MKNEKEKNENEKKNIKFIENKNLKIQIFFNLLTT
jgi:hypothetical protein